MVGALLGERPAVGALVEVDLDFELGGGDAFGPHPDCACKEAFGVGTVWVNHV